MALNLYINWLSMCIQCDWRVHASFFFLSFFLSALFFIHIFPLDSSVRLFRILNHHCRTYRFYFSFRMLYYCCCFVYSHCSKLMARVKKQEWETERRMSDRSGGGDDGSGTVRLTSQLWKHFEWCVYASHISLVP